MPSRWDWDCDFISGKIKTVKTVCQSLLRYTPIKVTIKLNTTIYPITCLSRNKKANNNAVHANKNVYKNALPPILKLFFIKMNHSNKKPDNAAVDKKSKIKVTTALKLYKHHTNPAATK
jgi:hypothetical protein